MTDVSLRPVEPGDAQRMLRWMRDPLVRFNVGVRREPSLQATLEWIRWSRQGGTEARAILVEGKHVGNVVLDQIDQATQSARLSIYIGAASDRLRGVGRRAIALILREAFGAFGLRKVWLTVGVDNVSAIRCYEAAGFHREKLLPGHDFGAGGVKDALSMRVLREEWSP